jgi:hypothetical protein
MTVAATSALAQTDDRQEPTPLPVKSIPLAERAIQPPDLWAVDWGKRQDELQRWVDSFSAWKDWMEQWGNRREPGWFSTSRERRPRPDPPVWLFRRCPESPDDPDEIVEACTLLAEWGTDYPSAQAANVRATATVQSENEDKFTWWEHVHLDAGWPALQSSVSLFGVVGMHATTTVHGRLEVFVAPGAMLLNVPTNDGGRAWKLATNYGIAYRLGEFKFPGNRRALLHLNLAKAWLLDAGPDVPTKSTDFVGFSVTFKKTP